MSKFITMKPFSIIPKIFYVYAGYKGFHKGVAFGWLGKMFYIIKPINERND